MSEVIIYHNPRCSKSRQTLELLKQQNIIPIIIEYLQNPPSAKEIKAILQKLNISARELMRNNEAEYKELSLANKDLSEEQLIAAMVKHPKLIQRPIVLANGKAAIGRPPEQILEII